MQRSHLFIFILAWTTSLSAATIAIIDTGFDLDHEFLKPKIFKKETDEEAVDPKLSKKFHGWNFHDNSHLKKPVVEDQSSLQEILLFRSLRAKGHREGLTPEEFEWFSKKNTDPVFLDKAKQFKRHAHGTFVAGIALREGENINIFPIRGLNIQTPVVAVEGLDQKVLPAIGKTAEEKFKEELKNSLNRVSNKFSKICHYLSLRRIEVVNASYGITYKNIVTKFRDMHREIIGTEIDETKLQTHVNEYFAELYRRGEKTIKKYPQMLFVFSAGNSGLDNDRYHHYPSKIKLPNTITVAAMNGDYLASFSNYGKVHVDVGAPGVAILSLVPTVYSKEGAELYSPSSGTSMAAPYISNLAAQILNTNGKLTPPEVKKIILETGDEKSYLLDKLSAGTIVNNQKALKATLLSKDLPLAEAINLAKLDLIPMEDKVSIGGLRAMRPAQDVEKKLMDLVPQAIKPTDVDDEPTAMESKEVSTREGSSSLKNQVTAPLDSSVRPLSTPAAELPKSSDPIPSNQSEGQSPPPSEVLPASSSQPESKPLEAQSPESSPSLPQ